MASSLKLGASPDECLIIGTGGDSREKKLYVDGKRTDQTETHANGGAIRTLSGASVSIGGQGLDGAIVQTTTPMDEVPAGAVYRASGEVKLFVRANARMVGSGADARAFADLICTVFVERLEVVGDVKDLLAKGASTASSKASS